MNLTENLFEMYWGKKIDLEEFIDRIGFEEKNFLECLQEEIEKTKINHDADRLENLLYVLFIWKDRYSGDNISGMENFLKILDDLLISDWHTQHENIVMLLQSISNVESLEYLFNAIKLKPEYLSWDDNYAFEVRCVRAIYYIGKEKSLAYLEKLCKHENDIIREMAQRQMKKIMNNVQLARMDSQHINDNVLNGSMYVRRIFYDDLEDVTNVQKQICFPSWKEVEDIINRMDGKKITQITMDAGDEDNYFCIGGGNGGIYNVYISENGNEITSCLINSCNDFGVCKLVTGGQEGEFESRLCVTIGMAKHAAKYYYETGKKCDNYEWE